MDTPVITANDLSKLYRLGRRGRRSVSLRESLAGTAASSVSRLRGRETAREAAGEFWALRNVSCEILPGETVGLIGRNGAGKSTLLKVLSRITRPTAGWAEVRGRVGSLLEVGTGFHQELTGRENVYLNGAILGMRRTEIDRHFDEIVAFAEVEDFLDTPIKRYSSGMVVRLAFAVAAHLDTEILIVDEVLAVGDLAFQRKCLGRMETASAEGRTVLFVSHNMAIIQTLCRRGILLEHGGVVADGPVADAVSVYLSGLERSGATSLVDRLDRRGRGRVWLTAVGVSSGDAGGSIVTGSPATFRFEVSGVQPRMSCAFNILDNLGNPVMSLSSLRPGPADEDRIPQSTDAPSAFECHVDELPLVPGRYRVDVAVSGGGKLQDEVHAALFFDVAEGLLRGRPVPAGTGPGPVVVAHRWHAGPR